ncbi:unnamed protein product [Eretmochelys imbricata]
MAMDTGRLEGTQDPPWNCQKSPTCRVVVALIVVSSPLIAAIIALAVPRRLDGIPREMLLFLRDEGSWIDSRSRCSAPGASLAGIDSEQEMRSCCAIRVSRTTGLASGGNRVSPGNGPTAPNSTTLFHLRGGGDCAYLNDEKGVSSSRCYMGRRWICSKPEMYVMVS